MIRTRHIGRRARGVTLIELMVALVLVGLIVVGSVAALRSLAKSDLREHASRMAAAIRYMFDRASTTGRAHRLVFDFEKGAYWAESTDDKVYLTSGKETEEKKRREAEKRAREDEAQKRYDERTVSGNGIPAHYLPKPYRAKRAEFGAFKETSMRPVTLPSKVKLADYYVPRFEKPLAEGQVSLYFFPMGQTEAATIHLTDEKRESAYTLVVHPLTGRVKILNTWVDADVREQLDDARRVVEP